MSYSVSQGPERSGDAQMPQRGVYCMGLDASGSRVRSAQVREVVPGLSGVHAGAISEELVSNIGICGGAEAEWKVA